GEACPALVEHQHAAAVGETLDVADEQRLLPGREQIAGDATNEDDVGRPLAHYLVGDRDLPAAGVVHVGRMHSRSLLHRDCPHHVSRHTQILWCIQLKVAGPSSKDAEASMLSATTNALERRVA